MSLVSAFWLAVSTALCELTGLPALTGLRRATAAPCKTGGVKLRSKMKCVLCESSYPGNGLVVDPVIAATSGSNRPILKSVQYKSEP